MIAISVFVKLLLVRSAWSVLHESDLHGLPRTLDVSDPEKHKNWELLDHDNCGFSMSSRIVGGKNAELGEFPWIVLIGYEDENEEGEREVVFACGGAIINRYYVITAMHCADPDDPPVVVRAGEHDLLTEDDCHLGLCAPPYQERSVAEVYTYSEYILQSDIPPKKDIALIKLHQPLDFNGFVLPVCLPTKKVIETSLAGVKAIVAGWGVTVLNPKLKATTLQKLWTQIRHWLMCEIHFFWMDYESEWQLCAGGEEKSTACFGDSGGPLVTRINLRGRPQFTLIGVVSFGGKSCGELPVPVVYARVTSYLTWILDHITVA